MKFVLMRPSHYTKIGRAVRKKPTNGWAFWRVRKDGELVKLRELRKKSR